MPSHRIQPLLDSIKSFILYKYFTFRMMSSIAKTFTKENIMYSPFVRHPNASYAKTKDDLESEIGNEHSSEF